MNITGRSRIKRVPKRAAYDTETIHSILDAAFVAHAGFTVNQQPFVIPTIYGRNADKLYLHGSPASRMLRELQTGVPACIAVTIVDALVLARSAFHHSMNYRSVVAFGHARMIQDAARKTEALRIISEHILAGRWDEVRSPSEKELKATEVLEFSIEEASAKIRTGHPIDDEADYALPVWAGILPLPVLPQSPIPDPGSPEGIGVPASVRSLLGAFRSDTDELRSMDSIAKRS
ncbi:pyridoxamine 5'-phosphate oxidase family protein [Acidicapsa acidisoli]|uniref:pyridoxamine 5'-phosphate oxidase family protein n=1 Tax=Acidicapsa acidisoli TaxID=1615681 RepID=UPI0021E0687D|nr:pyridoxamine 5'-phosphate oxidase family protein [Acidicapsa acidisoli]